RGAGSSPGFEAKGKPLGEPGFPDGALRALDVVANAPEFKAVPVDVPDAVARRRQAVSGLAHAARVDKGGPNEWKSIDAVFVGHGVIGHSEDPWYMGVAVETDAPIEQLQVRVCNSRVQDVLINVVARTRVHEQYVV